MRIAFSGAACTGKTTTLNAFLQKWPQYRIPQPTYRSLIAENNHSKKTNKNIQRDILNFMVEQQSKFTLHDKIVYDRCPIDNLVYTIWAYDKGKKGFTDKYIEESMSLVARGMTSLDIIFLMTREGMGPVEDDARREADPQYITETDNLFRVISKQYTEGKCVFFPPNDSPALIEITGTVHERLEQISMYVTEDGNMYGEEQSLINTEEIQKMENLVRQQKELLQKEKGIL